MHISIKKFPKKYYIYAESFQCMNVNEVSHADGLSVNSQSRSPGAIKSI